MNLPNRIHLGTTFGQDRVTLGTVGNGQWSSPRTKEDPKYVLGVVICSGALFFAGMSKVGGSLRRQEALLAMGWALLLAAVIRIGTSPVSFSV